MLHAKHKGVGSTAVAELVILARSWALAPKLLDAPWSMGRAAVDLKAARCADDDA